MKILMIPALLCALFLAGCSGGPAATTESRSVTVMRPTVVINTTKGPIRAVLFPIYAEYEGEFLIDGHETQYLAFTDGVHAGYYNGASVIPAGEALADYVWFFQGAKGGNYEVEYMPKSLVQPVRGTLCVMRLDRPDRPGIYADRRSFMVVRKVVREYAGQEQFPLKGIHFPIGQVIEGLETLDKLDKTDRVTSIVNGPDAPVSTEKLEKLGTGEIDNFAEVLEK